MKKTDPRWYPGLGINQKTILVELLEGGKADTVMLLAGRVAYRQYRDGVDNSFYNRMSEAVRALSRRKHVKRTKRANGWRLQLTAEGERIAKLLKEDGWTVSGTWEPSSKYAGLETTDA